MLTACGYGLMPAIIFAVYAFCISFAGQVFFKLIAKRAQFNFLELLGAGISIGTIVPSVFGFFLKTYTSFPIFLSPAIFMLTAVAIVILQKPNHRSEDGDIRLALITLVATSFAFGQFSHWFYVIGMIIAISLIIEQDRNRQPREIRRSLRNLAVSLIAFSLSVWCYLSINNSIPIWRQLTYIDQIFDETQSWSLASFGFSDNAFAAGFTMPGHTLAQTWAGLTQATLGSPSFMISGSAGILLALMGTCALLGGFAYRTRGTIRSVLGTFALWSLQMSVVDQFGIAPNPRIANSLSLLWFLFTFLVLMELRSNQLKFSYIVIPLFIIFTGFAKIHWAIFILASFSILSAFDFIKNRHKKNLLIAFTTVLGFSLVYLLYMRGLNAYANPAISFSIYSFLLYLAVFLNRSLGFLTHDLSADQKYAQRFLGLAMLIFSLMIAFTGTTNQQTYFITCSLLLISIVYGPQLIANVISVLRFNFLLQICLTLFGLTTLCFSIMATSFFWKIYENAGNSHIADYLLKLISYQEISLLLFSIFVAALFSRFVLRDELVRPMRIRFALLLSTLLLVANFNALVAQSTRVFISDRLYGRQLAELALSDEQFSVGNWIRANTDSHVILASNHYCQTLVSQGERVPISPEACRHENMNAWLSAISRRRLLLEAPIVSVFGPGKALSDFDSHIYNISLRVGQHPTEFLLNELNSLNVDFFVAENSSSNLRVLSKLRRIVYANARYTVFDIKHTGEFQATTSTD